MMKAVFECLYTNVLQISHQTMSEGKMVFECLFLKVIKIANTRYQQRFYNFP